MFKIGYSAVATSHKTSVAKHYNFLLMLCTPNRSTGSRLGTQWLRDSCYTRTQVTESHWGNWFTEGLPSHGCTIWSVSASWDTVEEEERVSGPQSTITWLNYKSCVHRPLAKTSPTALPNWKVGRKHYPPLCQEGENRIWMSLRSLNLHVPKK